MSDELIAVTGATGEIGAGVAHLLAEEGIALRLIVRDAGRAPDLGSEVAVIGGYADDNGLEVALRGTTTLFFVSAHEDLDREAQHRTVVAAAARAGVGRVVYLSFQGAAPDCTFTFGRDHWHTENLIKDAGLAWTFLRDSFYLSGLVDMVGADGVIRGPAGDGAVAAVDQQDVVRTAARILADQSHVGETLDVTGPVALTLAEVAATVTDVTGRRVTYVEETEEEAYASRASFEAPHFAVEGWVSSYLAIARGEVATVTDTVRSVTGRAPLDLRAALLQRSRA